MKMQFTVVAILGLLGLGIAQDTAGIKPCASGCVNGVFANGPNIGCAANDLVCVCGKTTAFTDGIHDCVMNACPPQDRDSQLPLAQSSGADQCKAASSSAGLLSSATPAPATSAATTPASVESQQAAATPSTAATETSAGTTASPVPTSSPASPTVAASSESALGVASVDSTSAVAESSAASSPTSSATTSERSSTTGEAAASTETASAETSNEKSSPTGSGLSVAARAGIGAGAGVAVVLAAILAFCLISRRRKQKNAAAGRIPTMQISEPLPGSGRQYADNVNVSKAGASLSKTFTPSPPSQRSAPRATSPTPAPYSPSSASYSSELDAHTQRYEDLLPRTQPHTMI
ncbi:hypothetical protein K449DRAFT_393772 [Hypoxylon sp. EC38]|nr:hypothetical protein K449DRAFT_393772 [Hypoxylon sp. EC38]